ncbi:uncharacterized protein LOC112523918 [Cynara cardunculus var. scolymus]|uniref:uncharacterized protein LOC112523918 n=1 Tax=Cynara cardunculus var. scolymus TaxID=59895 RepID=UPI000D629BA5|nr:uncharacterized protein LOC112523918 [Cynara cardunculus var. scolymus]
MAAIASNTKTHFHTRSISLPFTSDQSSVLNEKLYRSKSSQEAITSCSSSSLSLIAQKLNGLHDVYESVKTLLAMPSTQQSLSQKCYKEQMNELLDELLDLLDLCSTTKDALCMSMDSAKELQSVLRRKRECNHGMISSAVMEHLSQRRTVKKAVLKALSGMRKQGSFSIKEDHLTTTSNINILKEMGLNTFMVFESLLTFIIGSNPQSTPKGWSLVLKTMGYKRFQCDQTVEKNEVKKVDDELHALISYKNSKFGSLDVENIQKGLAEMEFSLLDLTEQVDCLCRHLIKTRVSLLNILNC